MIVMTELYYVYGTAGVILTYFLAQVTTRKFDPFAPTWLFLVGYVQIYIIQAISYHDWAVSVRGARAGRGSELSCFVGNTN